MAQHEIQEETITSEQNFPNKDLIYHAYEYDEW